MGEFSKKLLDEFVGESRKYFSKFKIDAVIDFGTFLDNKTLDTGVPIACTEIVGTEYKIFLIMDMGFAFLFLKSLGIKIASEAIDDRYLIESCREFLNILAGGVVGRLEKGIDFSNVTLCNLNICEQAPLYWIDMSCSKHCFSKIYITK